MPSRSASQPAFLAALTLIGSALASPALAEDDAILCERHAEVSRTLAEIFGEAREGAGLASTGQLIEVFATPDGATWTLVLTDTDGTSCILAEGHAWERGLARPPESAVTFKP